MARSVRFTLQRRSMVTLMSSDEPKLPYFDEYSVRHDQNWCPVGRSISEARSGLTRTEEALLDREFPPNCERLKDERRAAWKIRSFIDGEVFNRDSNGRQGAVDIELKYTRGQIGVVEVTSTSDPHYMDQSARALQFEKRLSAAYSGNNGWAIDLMHGWKIPERMNSFVRNVARRLEELDNTTAPVEGYLSGDWPMVTEHMRGSIRPELDPGVTFVGWNSNIPERPGSRYLDRLSHYLQTASHIRNNKLPKLVTEGSELGADERHLYLLVDSQGRGGGLLPISPAMLMQGEFTAPEGLTDLWLDGGTGGIFRWNATAGWIFHPDAPIPGRGPMPPRS